MLSAPSRRRLLAVSAAVGTAALAGCSSGCGGGSIPFVGADMPQDGEVATERVESVPAGAATVEFSALPEAERTLLRTAVEGGRVRVCVAEESVRADALRSFANRLETPSSYLRYEERRYGLWVRVTDVVYADTASPPAAE